MALLMALFSIPLAAAIAWGLSMSNHYTQTASEQTRLDAVSLSICHSRKSFLENEVFSVNESIAAIQLQMDVLAMECLATELGCAAAIPALTALSTEASVLMFEQDAATSTYGLRISRRLQELVRENVLNRGGKFEIQKNISNGGAGLKRENLRADRQTFQTALGIPWPRQLFPTISFEKENRFSANFLPERKFMGLESQGVLAIRSRLTTSNGLAKVSASCGLKYSNFLSEPNLKVERLH